jgi:hypothetical protein
MPLLRMVLKSKGKTEKSSLTESRGVRREKPLYFLLKEESHAEVDETSFVRNKFRTKQVPDETS